MWLRYLRLSIRNVLRSRARSLLTIGAIAFGVWMTLTLGSFVAGLRHALIDDTIHGRVGAIQIHRRGYDDVRGNQPLDLDLPTDAPWLAQVRAVPGVRAVSPRLTFGGILTNGSQSANFVGVGVDPVHDREVLPWFGRTVTGAQIGDDKDATSAAILGGDLAAALGLEPGASLTLQAASASGQQNAMDALLVGTVNSGTPFDSKRLAYVPLAWAQALLGMEGRATSFVVAVDDRDAVEDIAAAIQAAVGPELHVQPWQELRPSVADIIRVERIVLGAIGAIFLVIAIIGVANTMLMSVLERTREIGTMMALGVRRQTITTLFLFEGVALAVIGGAVGVGLATLLVTAVAGAGGIDVTPPGSTTHFQIVPALPLWLIAPAVTLTLLGTIAAAAWPAWRASKLRPVEALRAL